jgi:hypothetical protein
MVTVPVLICALALSSACTSTPDPGVPTADTGASPSASAGAADFGTFFQCLRQHGVNVPDPAPGTPVAIDAWMGQQAQQPGFGDSVRACEQLMPTGPGGRRPAEPNAQQLEQYRAFAICMRAHDIEVSDPEPSGNMRVGGRLANVTRAQLENDPGYQAAYAACKDKLPTETNAK